MIFTAISSSSAGNLYLVESEGRRLAIECGLSFRKTRQLFDFTVGSLDGLLLSHAHGDHSRAIKDVLGAGVEVHGSQETFDELEVSSWHRARIVKAMQAFPVAGGWRILPFGLVHDVPCLGFLVRHADEKLLYITDTAYVQYRFAGVTILAIEANYSEAILRESGEDAQRKLRSLRYHLSIERVLGFLRVNDLSRLREIHLLHLSDAHSDEAQFKRLVEEATGKPVYVAGRGRG